MQEGAFAAVNSCHVTVGPIVDISLGGLAFHYIDSGHAVPDQAEMNIWAAEKLCVAEVCFTVASDLSLQAKFEKAPSDLKRCGIQFCNMTPEHKKQLKTFISSHGLV